MRIRAVLIPLIAAALLPATAGAAPVATFTPTITLDRMAWQVGGIPDLDQIRPLGDPVLPGLGQNGQNFCAPTASADVLAFLSSRGFRTGVDGSIDYAAADGYDDAVNAINDLATEMGTNAASGTAIQNYYDTIRRRVANAGVLRSVQVDAARYHGLASSRSPTLREFAEVGISGGLMVGSFGWYQSATNSAGETFLSRSGGHAIALTAVSVNRSDPQTGSIAFRDPWSNSTLDFTQTPYADGTHTTQWQSVYLRHPSTGAYVTVELNALTSRANGFLEGYVSITPGRVWVLDRNVLLRLTPEPFLPGDAPVDRIPVGDGAVDVSLSPRTGLPTVLGRNGAIRRIGAGTGKGERMPSEVVARVRGASAIAEGRHGELLVAAGASIVRVGVDGQRSTTKMPAALRDIVVIEGGVVALTADGRRMLALNEDLEVVRRLQLKQPAIALDLDAKGRAVPRAGTADAPALRDDRGALVTVAGGRLTIGGKPAMKGVSGTIVAVDRSAQILDRAFYAKPFDTNVEQPTPPPPPLGQPQPQPQQ